MPGIDCVFDGIEMACNPSVGMATQMGCLSQSSKNRITTGLKMPGNPAAGIQMARLA